MKIIEFINTTSLLIIPMFIWGTIACGLIIEKYRSLNSAKKQLKHIHNTLLEMEKKENIILKNTSIQTKNTYIYTFINIMNHNLNLNEDLLDKRLTNSINLIDSECDKHMSTIQIMGNLFPMLGLLGTVIGMIKIFKALAIHGAGNMAIVSGGISEALITTEIGLISALPILFIHNQLTTKKNVIITTLDYYKNKIITLKSILSSR
jgi:biopolymer transport protein ExbB